jgi:hypothetical protein
MTYTVFDPQDTSRIYGRGLTAAQAMHEILTYDGYRYEIRKTEYRGAVCWDLYTSDGSENSVRGMLAYISRLSDRQNKSAYHSQISVDILL